MNAQEFYDFCKSRGACIAGLLWITGKSLDEFWRTCQRGDWMEWYLEKINFVWAPVEVDSYNSEISAAWNKFEDAKSFASDDFNHAVDAAQHSYMREKSLTLAEYQNTIATARGECHRTVDAAYAEYYRLQAEVLRKILGNPFEEKS